MAPKGVVKNEKRAKNMLGNQNKDAAINSHSGMETYKVAGIQMVSGANWQVNLASALALLQQGVDKGAKLLVLPENWAVFAAEGYRAFATEPELSKQVFDELKSFCRRQSVWVCAGSVPVPPSVPCDPGASPRAMTQCVLINDQGDAIAAYDKLHLFDVQVNDAHGAYSESDWFLPGQSLVVAETPFGRLGLSICYDLRFPEMYRQMALQGAEVFIVPSAFTQVTGQAHWSVLTRARAIENLAYVIATNQGGLHSENRRTWGHTCVVDPWGQVLGELGSGEGVITAEVDLAQVRERRAKMPVLSHGRLSIGGLA
jgi:nitrilase